MKKTALITGATSGIGRATAHEFAKHGINLVLCGRRQQRLDSVQKALSHETDVYTLNFDVRDKNKTFEAINSLPEAFRDIDILINNAGSNIRKRPEDLSLDEFRWVQDTNLTSAFVFSQAMYPHFKKAGGGKIINIGSMYSLFGGPVSTAYSVSKGGIVQMTKSMAAAWGTDNIQVNAVLPGWIDTELTRTAREQIDGLYEKQLARIPDGRWGTPEDHAGIAVFLSSNASNYITGTAIPVDGGFSISG